jgi:hypothetical protein
LLVGVSEPSVHRGHVGQPSPESVSRTAPPVTTITTFAITDARANRRSTSELRNRPGIHRPPSPPAKPFRGPVLDRAGGEDVTPTGTTSPPREG